MSPTPDPTPDLPDAARWQALLDALETGLLERGEAVRLALLAALAGEHILLIGPPGTAKSELARRLQGAFQGARYFERLLTRFSVPEELFGPLSLKALEHDRYERLCEGYLPTAGVAFLDEVFKANSAILNTLLTLLNERSFDNGRSRMACPLVCVVGATNEVPTEEALHAFYDRFLLRVPVEPLTDASFDALLDLPADAAEFRIPEGLPADLPERLRRARAQVGLGEGARAMLHLMREQARALEITVSDRRWRLAATLLRTLAVLEGRREADALDAWVLPYVVAARPEQVATLREAYLDEGLQVPVLEAVWLQRAIEAFDKQFDIERQAEEQDGEAGKLALARALGGHHEEGTGMTRLRSEVLEDKLRRRYSPLHVAARLEQIDGIAGPLAAQVEQARAQAKVLGAAMDARVWWPAALRAALTTRLLANLRLLEDAQARLQGVRAGFAALPVDAAREGAPPPIDLAA